MSALPPTAPLVAPEWLAAHLGEVLVLDATVELPAPRFDGDYRVASGARGWREARIPGALHADLLEALSVPHALCSFTHPDALTLAAGLAGLGVGDGRAVVAYDRADGFWAARLWWMARAAGVAIGVLDGGFSAWRAIGGAVASGAAAPARPAQLAAGPELPDAWVEREDIEAATTDPTRGLLVCALSRGVFAGAQPTRYARRGAIPGSVNLPARDLTGENGRIADPAALEALFSDKLGPEAGRRTRLLLYCGGGISAAYLALGLTLAGRENIAIYDNSLQEWAALPHLPLVCSAPDAPG